MSRDYINSAKERTGVAWLQRLVLDRVIQSDSPPKEVVVCEEVFVQDSELTQEDWQGILEKLGLWENDARTRMSAYKFMKEQPSLPFLKKEAATAAPEKKNVEAKSKKPKRRKAEPGSEGGSES